jgi:hypothetical protein
MMLLAAVALFAALMAPGALAQGGMGIGAGVRPACTRTRARRACVHLSIYLGRRDARADAHACARQLRARVGQPAGGGMMGGAQQMPAGGGVGTQQQCVGTGPTVCASTTQVRPQTNARRPALQP